MRLRLTVAVGLATFSAGCAVGPDFVRPTPRAAAGYTPGALPTTTVAAAIPAGDPQHFRSGADIAGDWWTLFRSPALNALVERALAANPSLDAAQAALRQAQETVSAEDGALWPQVSATGSRTRAKTSGAAFGQPNASTIYGLYDASVSVSYTFDVFGGVRRQIEADKAAAEYQRFELEASYLSLTANVVTSAVNIASLRGQIAATNAIIAAEEDQLRVARNQFELGGAAKSNVLQQQATLAATEATLPPLRDQLVQAQNQLADYLGVSPAEFAAPALELGDLTLPEEVPVTLPSQLVEQRPDIRAAEAQLHEQTAAIGVATANMLPQITLSGGFGSEATEIGSLFGPGTAVWSLANALTQPVFEGGTLLHRRRAAVAAAQEAEAQYRSTVIAAFQNVGDALAALQFDAEGLRSDLAAERAAAASLDLVQTQYREGGVAYLSVLTAEQTYQNAAITLVRAEGTRYADTAALFQALGGGWWHRADVTEAGVASPPTASGRSAS